MKPLPVRSTLQVSPSIVSLTGDSGATSGSPRSTNGLAADVPAPPVLSEEESVPLSVSVSSSSDRLQHSCNLEEEMASCELGCRDSFF